MSEGPTIKGKTIEDRVMAMDIPELDKIKLAVAYGKLAGAKEALESVAKAAPGGCDVGK